MVPLCTDMDFSDSTAARPVLTTLSEVQVPSPIRARLSPPTVRRRAAGPAIGRVESLVSEFRSLRTSESESRSPSGKFLSHPLESESFEARGALMPTQTDPGIWAPQRASPSERLDGVEQSSGQ
eukprot:609957-Hanusia_phi.AAC.1